MDHLIISGEGFPGTNEYLDFAFNTPKGQIEAIVAKLGNNIIVNGLVPLPPVLSDGNIIYAGELLPFVGGVPQANVAIVEEVTEAGYDSAGSGDFSNIQPVWKKRWATFGDMSTPGAVATFPFSILRRIPNLESLAQTGLRVMRAGELHYIDNIVAADVLLVTGDFTNVVEVSTGDPWMKEFQISFPQVQDYVPVIVKNDPGVLPWDFSLQAAGSTSLTIRVKFSQLSAGGSNYVGWFETHLKIYLLSTTI